MDVSLMIERAPDILAGIPVTLGLVSLSLLFGGIAAIGFAIMRLSSNPVLSGFSYGYVFVFRGTPLLVQIFLIYYGIGQFEAVRESFAWPVLRDAYWCAIIAFSLNTAGYTAEIFRGGIMGVPHGEVEAARAFGMSRWTAFRRIVAPSAFRLALPAYGNEIILMLKGSALASTITLLDLTGVARTIIARTYMPIELFTMAGIIYLILTFLIVRSVRFAEYRLSPHLRPPAN